MNVNGYVRISVPTLNALKKMLLSNGNNVEYTNIINDLAVGNGDHDMLELNVALVCKGIQPEFDKSDRFECVSSHDRQYFQYRFVKYSLIHDLITVEKIAVMRDRDSDTWHGVHKEIDTLGLVDWLNKDTDPSICKARINKEYPIPKDGLEKEMQACKGGHYVLRLEAVLSSKVSAVKALKMIYGYDIKEAEALVDKVPIDLCRYESLEEAKHAGDILKNCDNGLILSFLYRVTHF